MKEEILKKILLELKTLNKDKNKILDELKTIDKPIWVKSGKDKKLLKVDEIAFITILKSKINIYTIKGNIYNSSSTISKIDKEFENDNRLFRSHKSYIVNLNNINLVKVSATGRELNFKGILKKYKAKVSYDKVSEFENQLGKIK